MSTIAEELNIRLETTVIMKKSDWKRTAEDKIQNQIQERVEKEMENKTKLKTVRRRQVRSGKERIHQSINQSNPYISDSKFTNVLCI